MAVTTVMANNCMNFCENEQENVLLENLRSQRNDGRFCDIVLHVEGKRFPAHRSVLAASSPYFESVLKNHRVTKEEITIGWHDTDSFELLLDYMYTGSICIDDNNCVELLKLAHHFIINKLKSYCSEYLEKFLTVDNCVNAKELAEKYSLEGLQDVVMNFINDNITQILDKPYLQDLPAKKFELFISDPTTGCDAVQSNILLNAITGWVKKDIPKRSLEFPKLLDIINWSDVEADEVFQHLDNETLYQESKLCFYLMLRTLVQNGIELRKYFDIYQTMSEDFESNDDGANNGEGSVGGEISEDGNSADEVALPNSPILVEPMEVMTPSTSNPKRRGGRSRPGSATASATDEASDTSITKRRARIKTEVIDESETPDAELSLPRTRKRNVKQKYSSQEWVTDEPPTKRSNTRGTKARQPQPRDDFVEMNDESLAGELYEEEDEIDEDDEDSIDDPAEQDFEERKSRRNKSRSESIGKKLQSASLAQWKEGVKCPHCIYVGHSATRLEQHLARVHEEDTTYKCKMCSFHCKWNREYYKHMKAHFDGPPYKCEHCEYTCDRIQFILSHRMRHTDERPFHCELCPFRSRTKGNLIVHMRIHTGEKPYKCQHCSRCFAMKNTLDQHLATHRDDRPFLCDTCGFTTKYQSHLLSHKRIHTGNVFHCEQPGCQYYSPRRSQLAAHMRSHLSIRSHICSTCGRGFIEKSHLIRHERIHLDEKPFKCEHCEYGSTRRDKLKEHVQKHHSSESTPKTPYKPRKPRRQTVIDRNSIADDESGNSQLVIPNPNSPQEIQISQASQLSEQELATANLIYEYAASSGEVTTRVVIQPANVAYTDGEGETLIIEQQDPDQDNSIILHQGSSEPQTVTITKAEPNSSQDVGGLSAFMALTY